MEQSILNCWQGVYDIRESNDDLKRRTQEAYIKDVELKAKREAERESVFYDTE
jgi:hypothetical protein